MFFDNWMGLVRVMTIGPIAYVFLVLLLRASGKRTLSKMNAFDFVVTIAIGSMLASTILTDTVALVEGLLAMTTLVVMQFLITWLSVRSRFIGDAVKAEPTLLYHQDAYIEHQLKQTRVTKVEVEAAIRQQGYASTSAVGSVVLETDGSISVIGEGKGRPIGL